MPQSRKLHFENPDLLIAALHPGWIATYVYLCDKSDGRDMGSAGAKFHGLEAPPDDIKQTIRESR